MMSRFIRWLVGALFKKTLSEAREAGYKQGYGEGECIGDLRARVDSIKQQVREYDEERVYETMQRT